MITLSNIHQFTDEQIFDEVERLLICRELKVPHLLIKADVYIMMVKEINVR